MSPELDVFGTKFYPMNTPGATSTGWHQDNHYFGTSSDRVVSCAVYLHETGPGPYRADAIAAALATVGAALGQPAAVLQQAAQ